MPPNHQMKFAAAAAAARTSLVKGTALRKKLMSSAGAAVTPPSSSPPAQSSLLSRGMMASAAVPRPKLDPPREQHDYQVQQHHPLREEGEEKENEEHELLRRELNPPSGAPRLPSEARIHGVGVDTIAPAKAFPMWLGETNRSHVTVSSVGLLLSRGLYCPVYRGVVNALPRGKPGAHFVRFVQNTYM